MAKRIFVIFVMITAVLCMASMAFAVKVHGVDMPDTIKVGNETLVLNGAGVREIYVVGLDVYVAGLYLKKRTSDAQEIINANETMALKIKIVTELVTSKMFQKATMEGFVEATGGNIEPIKKEIDIFLSAFSDEIHKGDVFDIQYVKDVGVKVFKNGNPEPKVIVVGMPIKKALFGIWLAHRSEKHLQVLAKHLLGLEK